jgi:hypothetical protein
VCVLLLWVLVATRTAIEGWKGELFYAPCLGSVNELPPAPIEMHAPPQQTVEDANSIPIESKPD